jgi:nucleotide-binding universal stress UspA family protein
LIQDVIDLEHRARILVGTDLSAATRNTVWRAARLARARGSEVELMYAIPPGDVPVYRAAGWEANRRRVVARATGRLRSIASEAEARFDVPVTVHIAIGRAHAEIATRADMTGAGLVAVGPHRERPVRDIFLGETAQRLRRMLRAPLLIAGKRPAARHERALIGVDFEAASVEAARTAAMLFPDAALHFVHVRNPLFEGRLSLAGVGAQALRTYRNGTLLEASRELDDFIRRNGLQSRCASSAVKRGHIASCIREAAAEVGASVVALGSNGKSRFEANLVGSVSGDFLSGAGPDVLLVKAPRPSWRRRPDDLRKRDVEAESAAA